VAILSPEQLQPALDRDLQELADTIKAFIIQRVEEAGKHKFKRDQSGFVGKTKVTPNRDGIAIELPKYAEFIDKGRKPFAKKVPIAELIKWVKRYRLAGRNKKSGKFQKASSQSVNSMAYAIQRAIWKKGIMARPFIDASLEFAEQELAKLIDETLVPNIISTIEYVFTK